MMGAEILGYNYKQNIEKIEFYGGEVTFTKSSFFNDYSAYDMSMYVPDDFKVIFEYGHYTLNIFRKMKTTLFTLSENGLEIDKGRFDLTISIHKEFLPLLLTRFVFERVKSMATETEDYFSLNNITPDIVKVFVKEEPRTRKSLWGMTHLNLEVATSISRLDLVKEEMSNLLQNSDATYVSHNSFEDYRQTTTVLRMRPRTMEFENSKIFNILISKFHNIVREAKLHETDGEIMALSSFSKSVYAHCERSFDWLSRNHPYANNVVNGSVPLSVTFRELSEVIESARSYPLFGLYVSENRGTDVKFMMEAIERKYDILINDLIERFYNENGVVKIN